MRPIVVIPTYNESGNIEGIINAVLSQDSRLEVVVVDDNSPDGTGETVAVIAQKNPRVHLLSRKTRGRASAGIAGFKYALDNGYDVIVEMDADFSHDPRYIPLLLKEISNADVVIGSRYVDGGDSEHKVFPQHQISKFANLFNMTVLGLDVKDSTGGYRCYRSSIFKTVDLDNLKSDEDTYCIGAEILFRCVKAGMLLKEVPIIFKPRATGKSKLNWRRIILYPIYILKVRLNT